MLSAFLVMYVHVYHKSYFYNSIATVVTFVARLVSLIARLVSFIARLVSLIARLVSLIATQDWVRVTRLSMYNHFSSIIYIKWPRWDKTTLFATQIKTKNDWFFILATQPSHFIVNKSSTDKPHTTVSECVCVCVCVLYVCGKICDNWQTFISQAFQGNTSVGWSKHYSTPSNQSVVLVLDTGYPKLPLTWNATLYLNLIRRTQHRPHNR